MFKVSSSKYLVVSSLLLFSSCAALKEYFKEPIKLPAISVADKIKAFAIATNCIDKYHFDIEDFNFSGGYIKTNFMVFNMGIVGTMPVRTKMVFVYNDKNQFDMDFTDIAYARPTTGPNGESQTVWQGADFMSTDFIPIRNSYIQNFAAINADSVLLKTCVDNFLGKFQYNYVLLKSLTEVGREKFVNQYFLNREYKWSLPLIDFKFNKNAKYKKKYVALFCYTVKGDRSFDRLFSKNVFLNVYTDSDSLSNYTKQALVNYSGVLQNVDQTFASEDFNFDFFAQEAK